MQTKTQETTSVRDEPKLERTIEESIDIGVSAAEAYDQWTRYEQFPKIMRGVREVTEIAPRLLRWKAVVEGRSVEWVARVVEQIPGKRIAWCSEAGVANAGVVTFHRIADDRCRVMLQMDYAPGGALASLAALIGMVSSEVRVHLAEMKAYLEKHGGPESGDRTAIPSPDVTATD